MTALIELVGLHAYNVYMLLIMCAMAFAGLYTATEMGVFIKAANAARRLGHTSSFPFMSFLGREIIVSHHNEFYHLVEKFKPNSRKSITRFLKNGVGMADGETPAKDSFHPIVIGLMWGMIYTLYAVLCAHIFIDAFNLDPQDDKGAMGGFAAILFVLHFAMIVVWPRIFCYAYAHFDVTVPSKEDALIYQWTFRLGYGNHRVVRLFCWAWLVCTTVLTAMSLAWMVSSQFGSDNITIDGDTRNLVYAQGSPLRMQLTCWYHGIAMLWLFLASGSYINGVYHHPEDDNMNNGIKTDRGSRVVEYGDMPLAPLGSTSL